MSVTRKLELGGLEQGALGTDARAIIGQFSAQI